MAKKRILRKRCSTCGGPMTFGLAQYQADCRTCRAKATTIREREEQRADEVTREFNEFAARVRREAGLRG